MLKKSERPLGGGLKKCYNGKSLTRPSQGIHRQVLHPPLSPIIETAGIAVSQHAESIDGHLRRQEGYHMVEHQRTPAREPSLTYVEYEISNSTSDLTLLMSPWCVTLSAHGSDVLLTG